VVEQVVARIIPAVQVHILSVVAVVLVVIARDMFQDRPHFHIPSELAALVILTAVQQAAAAQQLRSVHLVPEVVRVVPVLHKVLAQTLW
jgi:hypothetical protein